MVRSVVMSSPASAPRRRLRGSWWLGLLALAVALLGGCRPGTTRLTVRGGPSLNGLFADLARAFEEQSTPPVVVETDFTCPPCILLQQPGQPVTFDLFVALGEQEIAQLQTPPQGLSFGPRRTLGHTNLVVVTSTKAQTPVRSLADLHRPDLRQIGIGDPKQTSVGHFARAALEKTGLWEELKPHFVYARSGCELLKWLSLGRNLDAAIVYGICTREVPGSLRAVAEFPPDVSPPVPVILTALAGTRQPEAVRAFMDFCASPAAASILREYRVTPVRRP